MKLVRTGSVLGTGLLLLASCRQILGIEEREASDAGLGGASSTDTGAGDGGANVTSSECGGFRFPSAACADCVDQQCCESAQACRADVACSAALDCALACTDASCRSLCAVYFRQPDALSMFMACRATTCSDVCGVSCGGLSYKVPDCESCVAESFCQAASACAKNADCITEHACAQACVTSSPGCTQECQARSPAGDADFSPLAAGLRQPTCIDDCSKQNSWGCVGTPNLALTGPQGPARISFTAADFKSGAPYVGTAVKACNVSCQGIESVVTNNRGVAELEVTLGSSGFDGYFELSGDGGNYPALWFPNPRYAAPGWQGSVRFISAVDFSGLADAALGRAADETRGHLAILAEDCNFAAAPGVSFQVDIADENSKPFYFAGGLPALSATATDSSGIGGFIDLPIAQGSSQVAYVTALLDELKVGSTAVLVKPGVLTTVVVPPMAQ